MSASTHPSVYVPGCALRWMCEEPEQRWRVLDGTVLFADVTGFTPMTEKLSRRGKVGAEELTDVLNDVFGRLLDVTAAHGGDLLKFGGDALLLLFTGSDRELRACAAAEGMQVALRPYRRFRTEAGALSLAMSAGVASGPCHLYLVGGTHRELVPAGPVFSAAVALEAAAPSGRTAVCPTTGTALPDEALGEVVGPGRLLRSAPACPVTSRQPSSVPDELAAQGVPAGLREHLRTRREWGEHRLAVLTFLQFKGTDALREDAGEEAVARALEALVCTVQDACERTGVTFLATDVDQDGGKVLLVAGAPTTTDADEDATLRAVRTVLDRPSLLSLRAGVNVGRAFAVDVGPEWRRTYAVMGDATNLAARVMGRAAPGQLVATQEVLDRAQGRYALTPLAPFPVKGKTALVDAAVVGAPLARTRSTGSSRRLVGRQAERALLRARLEGLRSAPGAVVELVGDTGAGKTRLVEEALALAGPLPRLVAAPGPYDARTPYRATAPGILRLLGLEPEAPDDAVAARLEELARAVAPELLPLLPLIGTPLGLLLPETPESRAVDPAFRRARSHDACVALMAAGVPGPLLVVVDDAQWLDDASCDLVRAVHDHLPTSPWLLLVTRRDEPTGLHLPDETAVPHDRRVLAPLSQEESQQLVAEVAGDAPLAPHVRAAVVSRGAGNPLFLAELVASAVAGGDPDALPDTVEAMVTSSVDAVPSADRDDLRVAAVLGPRFPVDLLDRMLADVHRRPGATGEADDALRRLGRFLVRDGGEVRFLHGLVREVAYEGLPFRLRRRLHGAAGDLLRGHGQDDDVVDLLALHYGRAGRASEAWEWTRRAAERARRLAAPVEAAAHLRSALDAARSLRLPAEQVAAVSELLGETCELLGAFEEAQSAYRTARRLRRGDPLGMARLHYREGRLRTAAGAYAAALRWYTTGHAHLRDLPEGPDVQRERGRLCVAYAGTRCDQGRYALALPHLEAAVGYARGCDDQETLGQAYYLLDWAHSELGDEPEEPYGERALEVYEHLGDAAGLARVYNNLGASAYFAGRWDEAVRRYEQHGEQLARAGDLVRTAVSAHNVAEVRSDQGRLDEAEPLFREALQTWRAADFRLGVALARSNLARLLVRRGRPDEAAELYASARTGFEEMGADAYVLETDAREVERLVALRRRDEAEQLLAAAWGRCDEAGGGGQAVLLALLDRLRGLARAQAGDADAAGAALRDAVTRARGAGAAYEVALGLLDLARLARRNGGRDAAAEQEAAALLADLGVVAVPALPLDPGRG